MQTTAAWRKPVLALNFELADFDLSEVLPFWNSRRLFSYADARHSPRLTPTTPLELTLQILHLQNPWTAFGTGEQVIGFDLADEEIYNFLSEQVAPKVNRQPQDAKLTITDGRATEFAGSVVGSELDVRQTMDEIKLALFTDRTQTNVIVNTIRPQIQLSDTNDLGIKELVASGESDFHGSSASRIQNIRTGASKFDGVILKPGEEFSFNHYLGPVSAEAGFKPELVIKSSGTVPELGGGLCQVSTTAFRAALYGGLPITARKNHSYAVKYYAPQGTDATIYPGAVDFKFQNDTPAYLLIHTRVEGTKLYFEYYGTKDARTVTIDGPYQYDFQPGGAMKARLSRTVVAADGKSSTEDFFSKYVSKDLFPTVYEFPTPTAEQSTPQAPTSPDATSNPAPGNNASPTDKNQNSVPENTIPSN
ncbi:MAG: VanW family protein [Patescibacteria group bacterium]|nr:VanW family protein [Patescibacteria group bacterium]